MMPSEKDRFGEKLRDAEKAREDQYFAKRDQQLIDKLRKEREAEFREDLASVSAMLCPRCATHLIGRVEHGIRLDECPSCGGLWLDKGEFESLAKREEEGWFGRLFRARQHDGK
jgi:hypothetical protein